MAWRGRNLYSTWWIKLHDRTIGEYVTIQRRVEEYEGYAAFGRFSYRGERLSIHGAPGNGPADAEDYPPPLRRCKTRRAKEYWSKQQK